MRKLDVIYNNRHGFVDGYVSDSGDMNNFTVYAVVAFYDKKEILAIDIDLLTIDDSHMYSE